MHFKNLIVVALIVTAVPASAAELVDIIRQSIRDGKAGGELTGAISETIAARTGSARPPQALVETINSFADPDCKRVRISIRQDGVQDKAGRIGIVALPSFELNMCLDGSPPKETLGADAVRHRQEVLLRQMDDIQAGRTVNLVR